MGWETRSGHRYFYTAERRNGRVVKQYWPGVTGELLAEQLEKSKQAQLEKQKAEKEIQGRLDRIDQSLAEFADLTQAAIEAVVLLNGFHFHRGEWRRKRGNETNTAGQSKTADTASETRRPPGPATRPSADSTAGTAPYSETENGKQTHQSQTQRPDNIATFSTTSARSAGTSSVPRG